MIVMMLRRLLLLLHGRVVRLRLTPLPGVTADRVALVADIVSPAVVQNHLRWHTIATVNCARRSLRVIVVVTTTREGGGGTNNLLARYYKGMLRFTK